MLDPHRDVKLLAGRRQHARDKHAVALHRHGDGIAGPIGVSSDAEDDVLADQAETRRLDKLDAAVALALMAGDERMQRRLEIGAATIAGMSWTSPSVTMITAPMRSGGTSARPALSAENRRVPSSSSSSRRPRR